jgi:hypothetical protein
MKFAAKKSVRNQIFHSSSLVEFFGSGIQNQGSGIRDPGWIKIRIRDKHTGPATPFQKQFSNKEKVKFTKSLYSL